MKIKRKITKTVEKVVCCAVCEHPLKSINVKGSGPLDYFYLCPFRNCSRYGQIILSPEQYPLFVGRQVSYE